MKTIQIKRKGVTIHSTVSAADFYAAITGSKPKDGLIVIGGVHYDFNSAAIYKNGAAPVEVTNTSASANTLTATAPPLVPFAYVTGNKCSITLKADVTGALTLDVNGGGVRPVMNGLAAIAANQLLKDLTYEFTYDSLSATFQVTTDATLAADGAVSGAALGAAVATANADVLLTAADVVTTGLAAAAAISAAGAAAAAVITSPFLQVADAPILAVPIPLTYRNVFLQTEVGQAGLFTIAAGADGQMLTLTLRKLGANASIASIAPAVIGNGGIPVAGITMSGDGGTVDLVYSATLLTWVVKSVSAFGVAVV